MANNRLYIKCKSCGEELCIGKHFGHCYFTPSDDTDKLLNDFYEKHAFCQKGQDAFADRGDFEITYEIEPNGNMTELISRADAIVLFYPDTQYWGDDIENKLLSLPSADRPHGEWINQDNGAFYPYECSNCHEQPFCDDYGYHLTNYCPNCGADMKGGAE